jgi:hypothetical protein
LSLIQISLGNFALQGGLDEQDKERKRNSSGEALAFSVAFNWVKNNRRHYKSMKTSGYPSTKKITGEGTFVFG